MAGALGPIASIIGIGSGVSNLFGGSGPGQTNQQTGQYTPSGQGSADQIWQALLGQGAGASTGAESAINPAIMQAFQQMLGLPIGQQYGDLSKQAQSGADQLRGIGGVAQQGQSALMNAGNQLWQTAQGPQNALRNQVQQQVTDASRAGTSARGLGTGAQAAGIENQDVQNFLLNWQNQQLGREATGLQGMAGAYQGAAQQGNQAAQGITGGLSMGALSPQFLAQGGMWPMTAANAYSGAQAGSNQLGAGWLSQIIPYLNYGQGATQNTFGQQQTGLNNLTTGLGQLGQMFGGGGGGGGGGYGGGDYGYIQQPQQPYFDSPG